MKTDDKPNNFLKLSSLQANLEEIKTPKIIKLWLKNQLACKNKYSGASFCKVLKIKKFCQVKPSLKTNTQDWKGAAPIFKSNLPANKNKRIVLLANFTAKSLKSNKAEPMLWIKKYLTFKLSWLPCLKYIKSKKSIKFSSSLTQKENSWLLESAIYKLKRYNGHLLTLNKENQIWNENKL